MPTSASFTFLCGILVSRLGSSTVTYQSLLFHSYRIVLIVIYILMEPLLSLCCHAVRNLFFNSGQLRFSNTSKIFHFTRWYLDQRNVPLQPWLLEGFEGRGTSSYLCDNSLHIKILSQKCVLFQNLTYIIPSLHYIPEDCLGDDQDILGV